MTEHQHTSAEDLASPVIVPEDGGICGFCQHPLADGESHLHNGWIDSAPVSIRHTSWTEAVNAYSAALDRAYQTCLDANRAAWAVYITAREAAEAQYERDRLEAGAEWDRQLLALGQDRGRG